MLLLSLVSVLCGFVGQCQHFGGTWCLHLQGSDKAKKWRAYIGFEEGILKERGQSERRDMGERLWTNRELSSRL
jgi:hypothetical protein